MEDELLIRQSIRQVIESMSGAYAFCGEASDGEMALSMMQDLMPDIVITDIRMPFLDGFELIRHAKAMMPWLKIIILSGFGDFESAQKAITLGVDQYLLKPIRPAELTKVIEATARQVDAARAQNVLPQGFDADTVQQALCEQFMQELLYGAQHTATLLEHARALKLDIVSPRYLLVLFSFSSRSFDFPQLKNAAINLLKQVNIPLYTFNASNQLTVLCGETSQGNLSEQAYQFINILRHELRELCPVITAVVSNTVTRLSMVCRAYQAAELLLKVNGSIKGQVVDANDASQVAADMLDICSPFGEAFRQKLQCAAVADVPALIDEMIGAPESSRYGSLLMRYNTLVNLLQVTVQQIAAIKPEEELRDIATRLSEKYDIFQASGTMEGFRQTAVEMLQQAVAMRQDTSSGVRSNHVISRAEQYVAENFCDPNMSLIGTARHVGLSSAHFSTVFSQAMGRSFISYLTALRMERAKELLSTTNMKLSDIAMEIGYNEPNYFSHVFRKQTGMTPKDYRNQTAGK